jgi:hypothetical protein
MTQQETPQVIGVRHVGLSARPGRARRVLPGRGKRPCGDRVHGSLFRADSGCGDYGTARRVRSNSSHERAESLLAVAQELPLRVSGQSHICSGSALIEIPSSNRPTIIRVIKSS